MESPESSCSGAKLYNVLLLFKNRTYSDRKFDAINTRNGFRVSLLLGFCVLYTYQEAQQLRILRNWMMNKDGTMLGALSSALEMHGDSVFISFYGSGKASLSLKNLYVRIASDVCG
jgi:hypothetical protein